MNFKNYLVSATAAALIASSALSLSTFTANAATGSAVAADEVVAASTFSAMPFKFLKEDKSATSTGMMGNVIATAQVEKTAEGKLFAYITETNTNFWTSFKTKVNNELVETTVVSENAAAKTRVVKFEIDKLSDVIEASIGIDANGHAMTHKVWLDFNDAEVKDLEYKVWDEKFTTISRGVTGTVYTTAQVQTENGTQFAYITLKSGSYWQSLKANTEGEFETAELVYDNPVNNTKIVKLKIPTTNQLVETQSHIKAVYPGGVHDTVYTTYFDFSNFYNGVTATEVNLGKKTYKALDSSLIKETSMQKNISPEAKVVLVNGVKYVEVELNGTDSFVGLQTEVKGVMTDVIELSKDEVANTRVVRFPVDDFSKTVKATAHVVVAAAKHDALYDFNFDFNNVITDTATVNFVSYDANKTAVANTEELLNSATTVRNYNGKPQAVLTVKDRTVVTDLKVKVNGEFVSPKVLAESAYNKTRVLQLDVPNYLTEPVEVQLTTVQEGVTDTKTYQLDFNNVVKIETAPEVKPEEGAVAGEEVNDTNKVVSSTKYNYSLVSKDKKTKSLADAYISPQIKVEKTKAGKYYATMTLKNATMWNAVKAEYNGKMVAAKTVSTNKAKNTKVIKFQVKSAKAQVKLTYTLKTSKKGLAGNYTNYINFGSKYVAPTTVISTKKYNYKQVKATVKTSSYISNDFKVEKTQGGKYYATVTVKNASTVNSLKADVNGKKVTAKTVSTNKKNNTSVVKFQIASPTKQVNLVLNVKKGKTTKNYTSAIKLSAK